MAENVRFELPDGFNPTTSFPMMRLKPDSANFPYFLFDEMNIIADLKTIAKGIQIGAVKTAHLNEKKIR
jgi:hypothetical protein